MDKVSGRCSGHEEVFIFVDKVNKSKKISKKNLAPNLYMMLHDNLFTLEDIKVRFFETDAKTNVRIWEAFADFSEADVHHQHAIAFRSHLI